MLSQIIHTIEKRQEREACTRMEDNKILKDEEQLGGIQKSDEGEYVLT